MIQSISIEKKTALAELLKEARIQDSEFLGDMTDDEIVRYLIREAFAADRKRNAIQMLEEMSADAIEYVYKLILWTYNYTDMHAPDSLSDEDSIRFSLANRAIQDDYGIIEKVYRYFTCLLRIETDRVNKEKL